MNCYTIMFSMATPDPTLVGTCIEHLRNELCKRMTCAARAYWLVAAEKECLIKILPQYMPPTTPITQPVQQGTLYTVASISIECGKPVELVKMVELLLETLQKCRGVQIRPLSS